jgi:Xaa-Pro dipeptidase
VTTSFNEALDTVAEVDGSGVDLGERRPASADFPIEEYRRRYARLAALMDRHGFDAVVFTEEEPVRYFTGYNSVVWAVGRWLPTAFVATRDPRRALLVGSAFDSGCAAGTSWLASTAGYQRAEEIPAIVRDHLAAVGVGGDRLGFEYGPGSVLALPQHLARDLLALGGDEPRDASPLFHAVRMLKSPLEVDRLRVSVAAAVAGYRAGLEAAKPGMTEKELVSVIASTMYRSGATAGTKPVFVNCVSGRERYALVDTPASDRQLAAGDIVFVDGGAASDGYVSDILRLIGVGPLRPEDRRHAEVAAGATEAMLDAVRPGVRVSDLWRAGAAAVAAAGSTEAVGVIAGHGIGLELWERPLIREHDDPGEDVVLRPGMVLCVEPILAPSHPDGGLAGIFVFEQQVAVTETGVEVLSGDLPARLWEVDG